MRISKSFGKLLKAHRKCDLRAKTIKNIAIFGHANTDNKDGLFKEVFDVSKRLAEAGYIVVACGGR